MLTFRLSISRVYIENSPNKHLVEINRHLRSLRWQLVPLEGRFFFIVLSTLRVCEPWNYPTPILWAINWESASKCLSNCLFNVRSRAGFSYIAFSGCGFSKCIWFFFRIGSSNPMGIESKRERECESENAAYQIDLLTHHQSVFINSGVVLWFNTIFDCVYFRVRISTELCDGFTYTLNAQ